MAIRTLEVYDSFDSKRLLNVRFEYSEKPEFVRTFRSSYASLWELIERVQYKTFKRERYLNKECV